MNTHTKQESGSKVRRTNLISQEYILQATPIFSKTEVIIERIDMLDCSRMDVITNDSCLQASKSVKDNNYHVLRRQFQYPVERHPNYYSSPCVRATGNQMSRLLNTSTSSIDHQYSPHSWIHTLLLTSETPTSRGISPSSSSSSASYSAAGKRRRNNVRERKAVVINTSSRAVLSELESSSQTPNDDILLHQQRPDSYHRKCSNSTSKSTDNFINVPCDVTIQSFRVHQEEFGFFQQKEENAEGNNIDDDDCCSCISDISCDEQNRQSLLDLSSTSDHHHRMRCDSLNLDDVFAFRDERNTTHPISHHQQQHSDEKNDHDNYRGSNSKSYNDLPDYDNNDDNNIQNLHSSTSLLVDYIKSTTTSNNSNYNTHHQSTNGCVISSIMYDPTWGIATATLLDD